jgi:hypothetical protein
MAFQHQSQKEAAAALWGIKVSKSSATVPQSTTQDIFTIAGGRVLVRALVGEVTVEIGAGTTPDLQVQHDPSVGTTIDVATDVVIASDEVGTLYYVEGDGTALIPISSGYAQAAAGQGFILPAGTLQIATSESTAGATKWDLWYLPLDDGAYVVSA